MTRPDLLTDWTSTPVWWAVMVVATAAYLLGVQRSRRAGVVWPWARTAAWVGAMALLVVTLNSSAAAFAHHLFWMHMITHLLLIMVIPLLLVSAQPVRLAMESSGPVGAGRVRAVMTHRITRFFTSPAFSVPVYAAVLVGTHLTGFQQAMSEHMWIHDGEMVLYLVSGYLLLLPTIGGEFSGHDLSHPVRFVTLLIAMGPDTLVGIVLMLTDRPLAPAYGESRLGWGPDALADQNIAGAIMWFGGDGLMMLLLVLVAGQWIRAETHRTPGEARRVSWLDRARQEATLATAADGDSTGDTYDIDGDDAALAAYNARLAALHAAESSPRARR
ncbi:cytochrome c oxidase assembly protein [Williamsia sp. M5A3_1d]